MRTIDADALSAFVNDLRSALHKEQSKFKGMTDIEFNTRDYMLLNFQYAIDNAPTVEPYQGEECVNIKMSDEEIKQFKQMLQEHTPLYTITSDTFVEGASVERPQGKSVIKCKDCKYQIKEWREERRMKDKGCWVYGCKHFGELMGYWGFGGNDNEFCSDAEERDELEEAENGYNSL